MSTLSQRLQLGVQQKQILTPGLVQMVTVLQLNRLELKDMIVNEIAENPVLEEAAERGDELTPEEVQDLLERERQSEPADKAILENVEQEQTFSDDGERVAGTPVEEAVGEIAQAPAEEAPKQETDPFDEIDFGSFFDDYLDPGFKSPAGESIEKPSFETFLSSPVTLSDYLQSQLSVLVLADHIRQAANAVIGNLEESGYLMTPLEEIAASERLT
ncbi:MAG TPA: hypothetical protein VJ323_17515, partial [Bryobacteraceae bacterium]|nr:hypothetical protein [Bryobacteraceae bacterium]